MEIQEYLNIYKLKRFIRKKMDTKSSYSVNSLFPYILFYVVLRAFAKTLMTSRVHALTCAEREWNVLS